jgi:hypothetical protein
MSLPGKNLGDPNTEDKMDANPSRIGSPREQQVRHGTKWFWAERAVENRDGSLPLTLHLQQWSHTTKSERLLIVVNQRPPG